MLLRTPASFVDCPKAGQGYNSVACLPVLVAQVHVLEPEPVSLVEPQPGAAKEHARIADCCHLGRILGEGTLEPADALRANSSVPNLIPGMEHVARWPTGSEEMSPNYPHVRPLFQPSDSVPRVCLEAHVAVQKQHYITSSSVESRVQRCSERLVLHEAKLPHWQAGQSNDRVQLSFGCIIN
jgi:hypothetical protein